MTTDRRRSPVALLAAGLWLSATCFPAACSEGGARSGIGTPTSEAAADVTVGEPEIVTEITEPPAPEGGDPDAVLVDLEQMMLRPGQIYRVPDVLYGILDVEAPIEGEPVWSYNTGAFHALDEDRFAKKSFVYLFDASVMAVVDDVLVDTNGWGSEQDFAEATTPLTGSLRDALAAKPELIVSPVASEVSVGGFPGRAFDVVVAPLPGAQMTYMGDPSLSLLARENYGFTITFVEGQRGRFVEVAHPAGDVIVWISDDPRAQQIVDDMRFVERSVDPAVPGAVRLRRGSDVLQPGVVHLVDAPLAEDLLTFDTPAATGPIAAAGAFAHHRLDDGVLLGHVVVPSVDDGSIALFGTGDRDPTSYIEQHERGDLPTVDGSVIDALADIDWIDVGEPAASDVAPGARVVRLRVDPDDGASRNGAALLGACCYPTGMLDVVAGTAYQLLEVPVDGGGPIVVLVRDDDIGRALLATVAITPRSGA